MGRYTVSERRACRTARCWRSSLRYQSIRDPLTALRQRMRDVAHARIRYGYRRLWVVMKREGWEVGKHRFYRVYCEEGWALRRKRPRSDGDCGVPASKALTISRSSLVGCIIIMTRSHNIRETKASPDLSQLK